MIKKVLKFNILLAVVLCLNGCSLIQAPFTIVQQILNLAIKVADKVPKYPGVF